MSKLTGTMSMTLIAYHANCIDGFTSAWVTYNSLTADGETCELIAMEYNKDSERALLAAISGRDYSELYVVDFSLEIDMLIKLRARAPRTRVIILDHHKTAFERYSPATEVKKDTKVSTTIHGANILLDNGRSGAGLTWEYFAVTSKIAKPWIIKYVQDYDLWKFAYGDSTRFMNRYLRSFEKSIENWDRVHSQLSSPALRRIAMDKGQELYFAYMEDVRVTADMAEPIRIPGGDLGLATECDPDLTSDVGHILAERSGSFGAMYHMDMLGNKIKWSLRSVPDYDVSVIAQQFGGGGHKNAAGFELQLMRKPSVISI
jgi:oligoribonuclease NrnB/cAMP/cGMP phosphodiesterase (DHH superfamily)